jgi:hypothetical protein
MTLARVLRAASVIWLLLYVPLETWVSWPGLYHPMYVIDFVGMALLAWGVMRFRSSAHQGAVILTAGWAWTAANFWRGTEKRFMAHASGIPMDFGPSERWIGVALTAIIIVMAAIALRVALARQP